VSVKRKSYRRKLYQYIVEELGQQIVHGRYRAGEVLPTEDRLCEELRVSRGVLREATKVLTQKGLIEVKPKVGTQVLAREHWNLFDPDVLLWHLQVEDAHRFLKTVTEVRSIIESEAARLAAIRAKADEMDSMKKLLNRMAQILADTDQYDYKAFLDVDIAFHASILNASHNDLLSQIGSTMREALIQAREHDARDIDHQRASLPFHERIVDAISRGDAEAAYLASKQMFDDVWKLL
jgi:DNA-binding FadR family transcriptional regulator